MDKIIAIGALNENTREFYEKSLIDILGIRYKIKSYNFNKYNGDKIDADILLISTPIMINIVKQYISDDTKLICISRTFTKDVYKLLQDIPKGTRALLVNNGLNTTFETISLIYSLGFEFELYPYYPGIEPRTDIDTAITTNEERIVPKNINKIYNIGHMAFDMSTIVDLMNELDINTDERDEILHKYEEKIIPVGKGVHALFGTNVIVKTAMHTIVDLINEGVLETDHEGNIIMANKKSQEVMGIEERELIGKNINEVFNKDKLNVDFNKEVNDLLIDYRKDKLIINLKPMQVFNKAIGNIITIKNVTELRKLEEQVRRELSIKGYLAKYNMEHIIGDSKEIEETKKLAKTMAWSNSSVLIIGESGTGKELFAQAIHNNSNRNKFPFVAINCAALPENLIESELFGYEGGAFTGAKKEGKPGLFEQAHLGTLFLDEIGDLQLNMQARLLRVIQEREVVRIGSTKIRKVDVRIISATNKDLFRLAQEGKFRWDLYYRLNVFPLRIPSLRERKDDIEVIFKWFLNNLNCNKEINEEVIQILKNHNWPGNIRELRNLAEYLSKMGSNPIVKEDLPYNFTLNIQRENKNNIAYVDKEILKILHKKIVSKEKVGRGKIASLLECKEIFLTEKEVRNRLEYLSDKGYVLIGVGRQGTKLSYKGMELAKKL